MKFALTCVATGPIVLLYPFVQKYFVKSITIGAVKRIRKKSAVAPYNGLFGRKP